MARIESKVDIIDDGDVGDDRRGGKGGGRGAAPRRKVCRFCAETTIAIDYKNPQLLKGFITDCGKMMPRRISGTCAPTSARSRSPSAVCGCWRSSPSP